MLGPKQTLNQNTFCLQAKIAQDAAMVDNVKALKWQKVHVFISSTFNDMHAERDYLVKKVFPELQEWCERRKLRLVDIDLRWGVTEQDATHNRNAVKVCLERIDDCRPFFLCFLGQRRGWVPREDEISKETYERFPELAGLAGTASITELEILHALIKPLHNGVKYDEKKPDEKYQKVDYAFFYLRDGSYLKDIPTVPPLLRETYTNEGIDDSVERERHDDELNKWREKLAHGARPCHAYTAEWDEKATTPEIMLPLVAPSSDTGNIERWRNQWVKAKIDIVGESVEVDPEHKVQAEEFNQCLSKGRLAGFKSGEIELKDIILTDLYQAITKRFPEHKENLKESELQKELDQQEEFLYINSEGFIERKGVFAELDNYLDDTTKRLFVLTAPGGMGKSMLLANWIDRRKERPGDAHTLHFRFVGQSDRSTALQNLLRSLMLELQLVGKIPETTTETVKDPTDNNTTREIPFEIPHDPIKIQSLWKKQLAAIGREGKTVIVIDAINQLDTGLKDIVWLPLYGLPENIKLIVSFRDDAMGALDLLQRFTSNPDNIRLSRVKPFDDMQDRINLVNAFLNHYLKEIDERHLREIIALPGAENPLYLKVVLSELRVFGSFTGLAEKISSAFGTSPIEAFSGLLNRLESDPAYSTIHPKDAIPLLFGLMAHARDGLTLKEIAGMFLQALGQKVTEERKAAALETAHLFLRQVRPFLARRDGRFDFFYESFKTAAMEKYVCWNGEPQVSEAIRKQTKQEWHRILAGYFDGLQLWENRDAFKPTVRKVAELPYHQTMGEMWANLETTLSDLEFLEAKIRGGLVYDLFRDLDMEGVIHTLPTLAFVRRSLAAVVQGVCERPNHALAMLWNQIRWLVPDNKAGVIHASIGRAQRHLEIKPWLRANTPLPGTERVRPHKFKMSPAPVQALDMAIRRLATADLKSEIIVRDILTGEEIAHHVMNVSSRITAITLSIDGTSTAFITNDRRVFFDAIEAPWRTRAKEAQLVCISGTEVIGVREDGCLVAWNHTNGGIQVLLDDLPHPMVVLRKSANGSAVLFVAGYRNQIYGVVSKGDSGWSIFLLPETATPIIAGDVDSDIGKVTLSLANSRVVVFDLKKRKEEQAWNYASLPGGQMRGLVKGIAFGAGPSAGTIFVATEMGQVGRWDPQAGRATSFGSYKTRREDGILQCIGVWPDSGLPFISTESHAQTLTPESGSPDRDAVTDICFTDGGLIAVARYHADSISFYAPPDLQKVVHTVYVPCPLVVSPHKGSEAILVGSEKGLVSHLIPGQNGNLYDFNRMIAPVIGVFKASEPGMGCWVAEANGDISCSPETPIDTVDGKLRTKVLWSGTRLERRIKVLPASSDGAFWSMKTAEGSAEVIVERIDAPQTSWVLLEGNGWRDIAASPDYNSLAVVGPSMIVYMYRSGRWVKAYSREEAYESVTFCCDGGWLVTACGRWLQLHRMAPDLPVEDAQDMGGTITCLASSNDSVAVGLQAGGVATFIVESIPGLTN
jgi:hypothetical protein